MGEGNIFKRIGRVLRNLLVITLIVVPCLYSVKVRINLRKAEATVDSLRTALSVGEAMLDSLKNIQDEEILMRDHLDDLVDRKLGDNASNAMICMDTTLDGGIALNAIRKSLDLDAWVDSLTAGYPDGVASHVKLHYLKSKAVRQERLDHHYSTKFKD